MTDSEFAANIAATGGGGVFGRATFVRVTFANNLAPSGKALWASETTQTSQCTDATPVDAGVHYTPLSAVDPC